MARTDIHRPSTFIAEDYVPAVDHNGVFCYYPTEGMARSGNVPPFQCDHCGHYPCIWGAWFKHLPTGEKILVGVDCQEKFECGTTFDAQMLRERKRLEKIRQAAKDRAKGIEALGQEVSNWLDSINVDTERFEFIRDAARRHQGGYAFSEKYAAAVQKCYARELEYRARKAAEAAEKAAQAPVTASYPAGRQTVDAKIVSVKWRDGAFPGYKMMVELADGNRAWGSLPASLDPEMAGHGDEDRPDPVGCLIRFTASFEVSGDDEHFGFFKRPTGAKVLDAREPKSNAPKPKRSVDEIHRDLQHAYNDLNALKRVNSYKPEYGGPNTADDHRRDTKDIALVEADIRQLEAELKEANPS